MLKARKLETWACLLMLVGGGCTSRPAGAFLGSHRCASCHKDLYTSQVQSHMAQTLFTMEAYLGRAGPLASETVEDRHNRVTYKFEPAEAAVYLQAERMGQSQASRPADQARQPLEFAVGAGQRSVTFLSPVLPAGWSKGEVGQRIEFRFSRFRTPAGWQWDWSPELDPRRSTALEDLGERIPENKCFECHATHVESRDGRIIDGRPVDSSGQMTKAGAPASGVFGVTCERCHGPSRDHAASPLDVRTSLWPETAQLLEKVFRDPAVQRQTRNQPEARRAWTQLVLCGACHRWDLPDDGDPRLARFAPAAIKRSKCFQLSSRKLRCTDCHDPHRDIQPADAQAAISVCLQCHQQTADQPACSTGAREDCIRCHMPLRNVDPLVKLEFHHHQIGLFTPSDPPSKAGVPVSAHFAEALTR